MLLLVVVVIGLALDLASKSMAFAKVADTPVMITRQDVLAADRLSALIPMHEPVTVVESLLEFTLVLNPGAVFGIGAGQRVFFVLFTVAALGFAVWMFGAWTGPRDRAAHVGLGLLMSGGLGNLYDRMQFACVRDFIHPLPGVEFPFGIAWPGGGREVWPYVSNVADLALIIGIGLLLLFAWRKPEPASQSGTTTES